MSAPGASRLTWSLGITTLISLSSACSATDTPVGLSSSSAGNAGSTSREMAGAASVAGSSSQGGVAPGNAGATARGGDSSTAGAAGNAGDGSGGASAGGISPGGSSSGGIASAGASAGGAGGGGVAGNTFSPCPTNGSPCKIMPLGDSITESRQQDTGYPGGYRVELFHLAVQAGKKITFVGSSAHGPNGPDTVDGLPFPRDHEGHAGYDIDETGNSWGLYPKYTQAIPTTYKPHIILLMIGTNDINNNVEVSNAPTRLSHLISVLTDENPTSLLAVAQIVPTRTEATNVRVRAYNAAIPDIVQKASEQGRHVLLVDMYTPFVSNAAFATVYMNDNLHPKQAGLAVMGQAWYETIKGMLHE